MTVFVPNHGFKLCVIWYKNTFWG